MQEQTTKQPEAIVPSPLTVKQPEIADEIQTDVVLDVQSLEVYYGAFRAVKDVDMPIQSNKVTAFIGPSGCGKSTVLRTIIAILQIVSELERIADRATNIAKRVIYLVTGEHVETKNPAVASS